MTDEKKKNLLLNVILWFFEGALVGVGAILPGISGGTLCVAFGMYMPIIGLLSLTNFKQNLKKYWFMLGCFMAGVGVGFVGFSGILGNLLESNEIVATYVTCAFVGFIIGTVPELFEDAGERGRNKFSYISLGVCFAVMLALLYLINNASDIFGVNMTIEPGFGGFLLCGILWGLSFIVPGLSSSSLIMFFGLLGPMSTGISKLSLSVIFPMGLGMLATLLLLAKLMDMAFKKYHSVLSHGIVGIVIATLIMILPKPVKTNFFGIFVYIICIICGAALSFLFTRICAKIKKMTDSQDFSYKNSDAQTEEQANADSDI